MLTLVRFLTELRAEIASLRTPDGSAQFYYRGGQLDLIDHLIHAIGEGALGDGTGTVQGGIELLSAEES